MEIIEENVETDGTTGPESPLGIRTSNYFDFNYHYDSVSAFSGSTVADSEFVAEQIMKFESDRNEADKHNANKQSTVYNLRIDKVVIDGGNLGLIILPISLICKRIDLLQQTRKKRRSR